MKISAGLNTIIHDSVEYSIRNGYELITPETLLLKNCEDPSFCRAFTDCGGDIDALAGDLEGYLKEYIDAQEGTEPEMSAGLAGALAYAGEQAANSGNDEIRSIHVINALWEIPDCYAVYFIEKQGVERSDLIRALSTEEEEEEALPFPASDPVNTYAPCLNDVADQANPLIGREEELERTIQVLCRKDKNNPLHLGEPGVGKTAIVYGLAQKINRGDVPEPILGSRIYMLDLGGMLAGTQYRGDFEKKFKSVFEAIVKEERPIVYIDEIHSITGAGAVGGSSNDAANMLKPYLSGGKIRFIGATTFEEYKKHFEKDKGLARRFQNIEIREPSVADTVKILEGLRDRYESFHGVVYDKGVFEYAAKMSAKYINERFLPDKAIDLIDEAGSYRKLHPAKGKIQHVDKELITTVLSDICRVPIEAVESEDTGNLATLEKRIGAKVFGQDEAVVQVVNAVKFSRAGLSDENKPLASLLFVGPTGVGKTEVAKTLAEELGVKLIRFDMSEYAEKHAVAKLIGSPAGYVGYEEGGLLTEEIRKNPSSVLLLDEIEKAHPDIYSILLQVMDYATLTDNQGRKADFKNVIVIMTSNAGANFIGKQGIGFNSDEKDNSALMEEVKRVFQPEFRNRLNRIIMFNGMDDEMAGRIVDKKLKELAELLKNRKITLKVNRSARSLILDKGVSREFGAREVDRVIRNEIKPLFVDEILFGALKKGGTICLKAEKGAFDAGIST
ncbi:MAG: AAA family ATPase [Lachnospiraceae bacterium]|nr:AAA family ATPase [Lachnospiraceae bacterium]